MIRWILLPVAWASHALLVLVLFVWLRSYVTMDWVTLGHPEPVTWQIVSERGQVFIKRWSYPNWEPEDPDVDYGSMAATSLIDEDDEWGDLLTLAAERGGSVFSFAGFGYMSEIPADEDGAPAEWIMVVPHWFLAVMFAIVPAIQVVMRHRRIRALKRALARVCSKCGYDPKTSHQTCPECGGPVGAV